MEEDEIKRKVIEASSGIPELGKIGREIETIGVLPVPGRFGAPLRFLFVSIE